MSPATILRIHSIISSALDLAVRYDWADRNVAENAGPPHPRKREPDPPTPDQAARLLNLVWAEDEEFGLYLWTAFTTGARRGEVSALRENRFDFIRQQVRLARNYLVKQGQHIEKAPKGRGGPGPVAGPADLRAVPGALPAPPRRGGCARRAGAGGRVRVFS